MNYADVLNARQQAETNIRRADQIARDAAHLLKGRLRLADVDSDDLVELKRELQEFNANTKRWKEKK